MGWVGGVDYGSWIILCINATLVSCAVHSVQPVEHSQERIQDVDFPAKHMLVFIPLFFAPFPEVIMAIPK